MIPVHSDLTVNKYLSRKRTSYRDFKNKYKPNKVPWSSNEVMPTLLQIPSKRIITNSMNDRLFDSVTSEYNITDYEDISYNIDNNQIFIRFNTQYRYSDTSRNSSWSFIKTHSDSSYTIAGGSSINYKYNFVYNLTNCKHDTIRGYFDEREVNTMIYRGTRGETQRFPWKSEDEILSDCHQRNYHRNIRDTLLSKFKSGILNHDDFHDIQWEDSVLSMMDLLVCKRMKREIPWIVDPSSELYDDEIEEISRMI